MALQNPCHYCGGVDWRRAKELVAACEAAIRYDECILGRAARGEVDLTNPDATIATGDDLDALYADWINKARAALARVKENA